MYQDFSRKMNYPQFLKYVLPSILTMIFVSFYTTIDGFFVSRWVGSDALASINIVIPITCVTFGIAVMLATGSGALVGIKLGENKPKEANGLFSFTTLVLGITSVIVTILGLIFLENILLLCGSTPKLMPYTRVYGFFTILMTPAVMFKLYFEYYARVDGKPKLAMLMSISGLIFNIIFDYICIVQLDMGIRGAGIGTALAILFSGLIGAAYFFSGKSLLALTKPTASLRWLASACYNGSSEMFTELSTGITTLLFNITILKFNGENGIAAMSIITYLFYFFIAVYFGVAVGTQPLISYNFGAGNSGKIKEILRHSFITILWSSLSVFAVSTLFAEPIIRIFTTDEAVIAITLGGLQLFAIGFLFIGTNVFISGLFTAIGNGKISAMISISRALVFVVIAISVLPKFLGISGVWLTVPVAELITIFLSVYFYFKYRHTWGYSKQPHA